MTSYLHPYIQESASLDSKSLINYSLTIQLSLDGLSFVIFNNEDLRFICLKHYKYSQENLAFESIIDELQERENWKLHDFKCVLFLVNSSNNIIIPAEYYDDNTNDNYTNILNLKKEDIVLTDTILSDTHNVYHLKKDIYDSISKLGDKFKIVHSSSILVESLIKDSSDRNQGAKAFVNVKNKAYELTIIDNGKLIFHNNFNFNTKEDFLYFILFTLEQHKLDNESIPLYFMGFIEEKSVIIELCSRYIRNIRFVSRNNNYGYINELDSIPYYYYYILYNSVSCE